VIRVVLIVAALLCASDAFAADAILPPNIQASANTLLSGRPGTGNDTTLSSDADGSLIGSGAAGGKLSLLGNSVDDYTAAGGPGAVEVGPVSLWSGLATVGNGQAAVGIEMSPAVALSGSVPTIIGLKMAGAVSIGTSTPIVAAVDMRNTYITTVANALSALNGVNIGNTSQSATSAVPPSPMHDLTSTSSIQQTANAAIASSLTVGVQSMPGAAANGGDLTISDPNQLSYTALGAANTSTEEITATAHGLATGAGPFYVADGDKLCTADNTPFNPSCSGAQTGDAVLPGGLSTRKSYWVINAGTNSIKLAESYAAALAGTAVDITSTGTATNVLGPPGGGVIAVLASPGASATSGKTLSVDTLTGLQIEAPRISGAGTVDIGRATGIWIKEQAHASVDSPCAICSVGPGSPVKIAGKMQVGDYTDAGPTEALEVTGNALMTTGGTIYGDDSSGGDLTLSSTKHSTKGSIFLGTDVTVNDDVPDTVDSSTVYSMEFDQAVSITGSAGGGSSAGVININPTVNYDDASGTVINAYRAINGGGTYTSSGAATYFPSWNMMDATAIFTSATSGANPVSPHPFKSSVDVGYTGSSGSVTTNSIVGFWDNAAARNTTAGGTHAVTAITSFAAAPRLIETAGTLTLGTFTGLIVQDLNTNDTGVEVGDVATAIGIDLAKQTLATTNIEFRNAGKMVYTPTAESGLGAGFTITPSASIIEMQTTGNNNRTSSTTTPISAGQAGQVITLVNVDSDSNTITIDGAGGNVQLAGGVDYVMGINDTLTLAYSATRALWLEQSRSNN